jgi:hypothetical protein
LDHSGTGSGGLIAAVIGHTTGVSVMHPMMPSRSISELRQTGKK